ncbi:MAG: hypothetical protein GF411_16940 [Candidatus Lokiarchaeota archaeon]|nr:hypothetical protein [Candidatus Lokiarchaeota archaeon]
MNMDYPYNIIFAGVGGQGNVIAGRVLAKAVQLEELRPVVGETFGASRRGGSVFTHIRVWDKDASPLVPKGTLNLLIGLEPIESLRASVKFAGSDTIAILSKTPIYSSNVHRGTEHYPDVERIVAIHQKICMKVIAIDTDKILRSIDAFRSLNVLLIGVMAGMRISPLSIDSIRAALINVLGSSEKNLEAFDIGVSQTTQ